MGGKGLGRTSHSQAQYRKGAHIPRISLPPPLPPSCPALSSWARTGIWGAGAHTILQQQGLNHRFPPPRYSNWPTIPQCYIDGEFVGGCDLLIEMYQNGELQEMVEKAAAS